MRQVLLTDEQGELGKAIAVRMLLAIGEEVDAAYLSNEQCAQAALAAIVAVVRRCEDIRPGFTAALLATIHNVGVH